jgi:hypothetical protein
MAWEPGLEGPGWIGHYWRSVVDLSHSEWRLGGSGGRFRRSKSGGAPWPGEGGRVDLDAK